ncbi:aquaporin-10-like [Tropilaelaps mercedesae]|uniref:Aquaporin-10-like n=1 Tax=Tropilaelaps mercedesae TaxID=418985 RepID=A0A1V9WY76_9ACAR|nr:aquaporin-10-like [Tropilaelaps mercedesae]
MRRASIKQCKQCISPLHSRDIDLAGTQYSSFGSALDRRQLSHGVRQRVVSIKRRVGVNLPQSAMKIFHKDNERLRQFRMLLKAEIVQEILAESAGTFLLVLFGIAGPLNLRLTGVSSNILQRVICAAGVFLGIIVAVSSSGGHINPAVSTSLATRGHLPWKKLLHYIVAQYTGAFAAAAVVYITFWEGINRFDGGVRVFGDGPNATGLYFASYPDENVSLLTCFVDTLFCSGLLMYAVCAIANEDRVPMYLWPAFVAFCVFSIEGAFSYNCGPILNPARDLAPRLFTVVAGYGFEGFRSYHGKFWIVAAAVPHLGACIGAQVYHYSIHMRRPFDDVDSRDATDVSTDCRFGRQRGGLIPTVCVNEKCRRQRELYQNLNRQLAEEVNELRAAEEACRSNDLMLQRLTTKYSQCRPWIHAMKRQLLKMEHVITNCSNLTSLRTFIFDEELFSTATHEKQADTGSPDKTRAPVSRPEREHFRLDENLSTINEATSTSTLHRSGGSILSETALPPADSCYCGDAEEAETVSFAGGNFDCGQDLRLEVVESKHHIPLALLPVGFGGSLCKSGKRRPSQRRKLPADENGHRRAPADKGRADQRRVLADKLNKNDERIDTPDGKDRKPNGGMLFDVFITSPSTRETLDLDETELLSTRHRSSNDPSMAYLSPSTALVASRPSKRAGFRQNHELSASQKEALIRQHGLRDHQPTEVRHTSDKSSISELSMGWLDLSSRPPQCAETDSRTDSGLAARGKENSHSTGHGGLRTSDNLCTSKVNTKPPSIAGDSCLGISATISMPLSTTTSGYTELPHAAATTVTDRAKRLRRRALILEPPSHSGSIGTYSTNSVSRNDRRKGGAVGGDQTRPTHVEANETTVTQSVTGSKVTNNKCQKIAKGQLPAKDETNKDAKRDKRKLSSPRDLHSSAVLHDENQAVESSVERNDGSELSAAATHGTINPCPMSSTPKSSPFMVDQRQHHLLALSEIIPVRSVEPPVPSAKEISSVSKIASRNDEPGLGSRQNRLSSSSRCRRAAAKKVISYAESPL